jgi:short-subunit dehydrogenase
MDTKTALITGASSGIGYELAMVHASKKGDLVLVARREDKLLEMKHLLEKKYAIAVEVIALDLIKEGSIAELYNRIVEKNICIDYLINNAGFGEFGFFHENDWEKEAAMIDLNIKALTHLTKIFIKEMVKRGNGKILNVASTAAFQPGPLMAVYYATKHYVLAFTEAVANELKGTNVTLTALCPGPTQSGFLDAANLKDSKLFKRLKPANSREVAVFGYKKMLAGNTLAIHGWLNRIMAFSTRFLPRKFVASTVRNLQKKTV